MAPPTPAQSQKYERTPKGHLMRTYRNMLSRVLGIQRREAKFYEGLPILPKEEFYRWALNPASTYHDLYTNWSANNFARRLSPSVDRLDVLRGYTLDNMQWLTHGQNSARITRKRQPKENQHA